MNYKIVAFSDLHLKLSDPLGVPTVDGLTTRVQQKAVLLDKVIDKAIEVKANEIVNLGDTYDSINPASRLRVVHAQAIKRAQESGIEFTEVAGNHGTDGRHADGIDLSLVAGKYHLVTEHEIHPLFENLSYIPELSNEGILKAVQEYPDNMIIGHFGVNGAKYPSGKEDVEGAPQLFFASRKFPTFLGHIHLRQVFCNENVIYIGALARANFGDKDILTGCCIINLELDYSDDGEHRLTRLIKDVKYEFCDFKDIGLHQCIIREKGDDDDPVMIDLSEGDIVKLVYEGSHEWFAGRNPNELATTFKIAGAARVFIDFRPTARTVDGIDDSIRLGEDSLDFEKYIIDQAKADKVDPELGLDYLRKANENL